MKDSDGSVIWKKSFEKDMSYGSPVSQADGTFLLGGLDNYLYCMDSATGDIKWKWQTLGKMPIWATPAVGNDGVIYVGSEDRYMYALKSNPNPDVSSPNANNEKAAKSSIKKPESKPDAPAGDAAAMKSPPKHTDKEL